MRELVAALLLAAGADGGALSQEPPAAVAPERAPIPQAAKQKLMELPDPIVRLQLVDDFLRSKGVVA